VTVVGEALVDVISDASGVRRHPGGSPLNVAVGLARLGHASTLVARLGDDADGALLREHLGRAGVDLVPGAVDGGPTSVAEAVLDDAGHAEYTFRLDWRVPDGQLPTPPEHVHTGSIAVFLPPGADQVLALLARHAPQATTSFDPNVRPAIIGEVEAARRRVAELVAVSDVVKVSDEDLGWLEPGRDITAVAQEWREQGPGLVVVTRGSEGAVAVAASGSVHVPAPPVDGRRHRRRRRRLHVRPAGRPRRAGAARQRRSRRTAGDRPGHGDAGGGPRHRQRRRHLHPGGSRPAGPHRARGLAGSTPLDGVDPARPVAALPGRAAQHQQPRAGRRRHQPADRSPTLDESTTSHRVAAHLRSSSGRADEGGELVGGDGRPGVVGVPGDVEVLRSEPAEVPLEVVVPAEQDQIAQ
jgi:fructokinase